MTRPIYLLTSILTYSANVFNANMIYDLLYLSNPLD